MQDGKYQLFWAGYTNQQGILKLELELDLPVTIDTNFFADVSLKALTNKKFDLAIVWHYMPAGELILPTGMGSDDHEGIARIVVEGTRRSQANAQTPILVTYLQARGIGNEDSMRKFRAVGATECLNIGKYGGRGTIRAFADDVEKYVVRPK